MPLYGGNLANLQFDMSMPSSDFSGGYTGSSLPDFYDYLMTPRHYQQWSGTGAIRHYGPSRYASVRPQDAAMAGEVLKQIDAQNIMTAEEEARQSELGRRRAADELMREARGYGGGTISMGQGPAIQSEEIKGRRGAPIDMDDPVTRAILYGGGYQPDPERQAEAYGAGRGGGSGITPYQLLNLEAKFKSAASSLEMAAQMDPEWAGLSGVEIMLKARSGAEVPYTIQEALPDYIDAWTKAERLGKAEEWGATGGATQNPIVDAGQYPGS